jgi:RNA polymerase sigma factor (sigma-70 family)
MAITTMAATSTSRDETFEQIVSAHVDILRRYAARHVARSAVDQDDALQDALIRLWREWSTKGLPADPRARLSYMLRAVRCAARDAVRRHHREGSSRDRVVPADLQLAEAHAAEDDPAAGHVAAVAKAIHRDAANHSIADLVVDREVLISAIAKLDELELRVICGIGEGTRYDELAAELGVTKAQVNNAANRARTLLVGLIEHASDTELQLGEREQLVAFLNGEIRDRKRRRAAQRHLDNCDLCRHVAEMERRVERAAAAVFAPLPALLGLKPVAAAAAGAASVVPLAGSASTGGASATSGGLLAATGAKGAIAAAVVALGTTAAIPPLAHRHRPAKTQTIATPVPARGDVTAATLVPSEQALPSPERQDPHGRRAHPDRSHGHRRAHVIQLAAPETAMQPPAQTARAQAPVPATTSSAPHPRSDAGGEFVLGGHG